MLISHSLCRNAEGTRITLVYKIQFLCSSPTFLDGYKNMTETTDMLYIHHKKHYISVYDQHFYGEGEKGWWMGRGVAVKDVKGEMKGG